jgi:uncharacterized protein (UPF0254 family)
LEASTSRQVISSNPKYNVIILTHKTNDLFVETDDGSADLIIKDGKIKLRGSNGMNKAYIIKLSK